MAATSTPSRTLIASAKSRKPSGAGFSQNQPPTSTRPAPAVENPVPGIFPPAAASQKPQQLPQTRGMNSVAINKLMLSFATPVFQRLADGHWHNFLTHEAQAAATRKLATSSLH
jgi:hypothetical protein